MDDYNRGGHSKYSLKVHIIFATKYRKKLFKSGKRADDVSNGRRVSTRLRACGFTADNL